MKPVALASSADSHSAESVNLIRQNNFNLTEMQWLVCRTIAIVLVRGSPQKRVLRRVQIRQDHQFQARKSTSHLKLVLHPELRQQAISGLAHNLTILMCSSEVLDPFLVLEQRTGLFAPRGGCID